jgi:hypothetical protein
MGLWINRVVLCLIAAEHHAVEHDMARHWSRTGNVGCCGCGKTDECRHSYQVQAYRNSGASHVLFNWNAGSSNFVIEERERGNAVLLQSLADRRSSNTNWATIPGREITHVKQLETSMIRVTLMEQSSFT